MEDPTTTSPSVDELGEDPVLAVDMNAGHLAAVVLDPCGNPMGVPVTISLDLAGLSTRPGTAACGQRVHRCLAWPERTVAELS